MISLLLYKREMKGSIKVLLIFAAVITLYVTVIIRMYDPEMMKTLDDFGNERVIVMECFCVLCK